MAGERRGGWLLLLGALAIIAVAGVIVYRATHRERRPTLVIFHWVPGPTPLKIVGPPPFGNMEREVDPYLLNLLHESALTGELRFVGELSTHTLSPAVSSALLLQSMPQQLLTLSLVDSKAAVFIEAPGGLKVLPAGAPSLKATVTLTPSTTIGNPGWYDYLMNASLSVSTGAVQLAWW